MDSTTEDIWDSSLEQTPRPRQPARFSETATKPPMITAPTDFRKLPGFIGELMPLNSHTRNAIQRKDILEHHHQFILHDLEDQSTLYFIFSLGALPEYAPLG